MGAVDTCIDMGGGVTLAGGFYDAFSQDGKSPPILASVGDSTFFHACLPPLYDAVKTGKKFILVIMDNGATAMTGMQPTPQTGVRADGVQGHAVPIEEVVRGFGVNFLRILDPYGGMEMVSVIREAEDYLEREPGPAVIIARRECILLSKGRPEGMQDRITLEEECAGCGRCIERLDCPALSFNREKKRAVVDDGLCVKCGVCVVACSMIRPKKKAERA
jgi:indolepyruvate ferredoxin oxidoreductase, alpha subunit